LRTAPRRAGFDVQTDDARESLPQSGTLERTALSRVWLAEVLRRGHADRLLHPDLQGERRRPVACYVAPLHVDRTGARITGAASVGISQWEVDALGHGIRARLD
jgi:hypothetical protein